VRTMSWLLFAVMHVETHYMNVEAHYKLMIFNVLFSADKELRSLFFDS
jgi:hypothetical protein